MNQPINDIYSDKRFEAATSNGGGKYAMPGFYPKAKITGVKNISTQDGPAVVVEYDILESSVPECPPGNGYGYVMKAKHASFFSNVRRVIGELTGDDFEKVDRDVCRGVTSQAQPLAGTLVSLTARQKKTKTGGAFTVHLFGLIEKSAALKALEAAPPTA